MLDIRYYRIIGKIYMIIRVLFGIFIAEVLRKWEKIISCLY